eukprot:5082182-Amphidinium_carterae.1
MRLLIQYPRTELLHCLHKPEVQPNHFESTHPLVIIRFLPKVVQGIRWEPSCRDDPCTHAKQLQRDMVTDLHSSASHQAHSTGHISIQIAL